jgi:isopentenyldiphosphate isomerase
MEKEFINVIDENLKILSKEEREVVHEKGLLHQAARALLINSSQKVLLIKRKKNGCLSRAHLDITVSTDLFGEETGEEAILRSLSFDLGGKFEKLSTVGLGKVKEYKIFKKSNCIDNTISQVFLIKGDIKNSSIHLNLEEIEGILWLNYTDFVKKFFTTNYGGLNIANRKKVYYELFQALGIPSLK